MGDVPESRSEQQLAGAEATRPKNQYVTPQLVEYGSIAKLTQGASAGAAEGGFMAACL